MNDNITKVTSYFNANKFYNYTMNRENISSLNNFTQKITVLSVY